MSQWDKCKDCGYVHEHWMSVDLNRAEEQVKVGHITMPGSWRR